MRTFKNTATIALAAATIAAFPSCRLGNHVEQTKNEDDISGYYETQAQSLTFCAPGTNTCNQVSPNLVPAFVSQMMTNPVIFAVEDASKTSAVLASSDGNQIGMRVTLSPDLQFNTYAWTSPETLWRDPNCAVQQSVKVTGSVTRSNGPWTSGATVQPSGRISAKIEVFTGFGVLNTSLGTCEASLQSVYNCYSDYNLCDAGSDGANQYWQLVYQSIFNMYIQAGVMTAQDIPTVQTLSYEVSYQ